MRSGIRGRYRARRRHYCYCMRTRGVVLVCLLAASAPSPASTQGIEWWASGCARPLKLLSCGVDNTSALTPQPSLTWTDRESAAAGTGDAKSPARIVVDGGTRYQTVYGIGNSLEASTGYNLQLLEPPARTELLRSLFDPDEGIGMSLARITIATSDFTPLPFYSYNDLSDPNATDINLTHFSVARDEAYILPLIKAALAAAEAPGGDTLKLFASPWSPPAWMKTSKRLEGGALLPEHYGTYAKYLIRFLEEYETRGVHLSAMTVQNEPLQNDNKYPTMLLEPKPEAQVIEAMNDVFYRKMSSPLSTLPDIWSYDHNWDDIAYPEFLLNNSHVSPYVHGSAFHHYAGKPSAMTTLHEHFPDKPIFMTEGSEFGVSGAARIVTYFRNWATTYMAWVTMLDQHRKPNSGPFSADATMVELDTITKTVKRNFEYYMYGHFSKFVRSDAVRIDSKSLRGSKSLEHVAFVNAAGARGAGNAGATVVVVVNTGFEDQEVQLQCKDQLSSVAKIVAHSLSTFRWHGACT